MTINYQENKIELTEDGNYRPNKLLINGEIATMDLYAERHNGKNWTATASGNVLYYATESGKEYFIPQSRLMNTYQDELREAIVSTGKTTREVAELIGVTVNQLKAFRSGEEVPSKSTQATIIEKIKKIGEDE